VGVAASGGGDFFAATRSSRRQNFGSQTSLENEVFEGGLGNFRFFHTGGKFFFGFLVVFNSVLMVLNQSPPVRASPS
jgi:hypothetical protein